MTTYPRETIEYVTLPEVLRNGVPVTGFEYAVHKMSDRPAVWQTPETVEGAQAFRLDGTLPRGDYKIWIKVTTNTETVVIEAGTFGIS